MAEQKIVGNLEAWITLKGAQQFVAETNRVMQNVQMNMGKIERSARKIILLLTGIGGAAIKMTSDFERGITEISTLGDYTKEQLDEIEKGIRKTAEATGESLADLTKARYDIISSGFESVADSEKLMAKAAEAAIGGVSDVATTAKVGVGILNSYKMGIQGVDEVYDMLFATIKYGTTTMEELAPSIGQLTPIAYAAHLSLKNLGAVIATVTNAGIETPIAITAIRGALLALVAPTEAARQAMREMGIEVKYLNDGTLDILGTMAQFQGLPLNVIQRIIPDVRAANGIQVLANNFDILSKNVARFTDISGSSQAAAEKMDQSFDRLWKKTLQKFKGLMIDLGKELLLKVADGIDAINSRVELFQPKLQELIAGIGKIVGWVVEHPDLIGKLFIYTIIAKVTMGLFNLGTAIVGVATALKTLSIAVFTNPVTAVLGTLAVGITGVALAIKQFKSSLDALDPAQMDKVFYVPPGMMKYEEWYAKNKTKLEELRALLNDDAAFAEQVKNLYRQYLQGKEVFQIGTGRTIEIVESGTKAAVTSVPTGGATKPARNQMTAEEAEFQMNLALITALGEAERLKILKEGLAKQLSCLDAGDEDYLNKKRNLELKLAQVDKAIADNAIQTQMAKIDHELELSLLTASSEEERLRIQKAADEKKLALFKAGSDEYLALKRKVEIDATQIEVQELEVRKQKQIEYIQTILSAIRTIASSIGGALSWARDSIKEMFKSILITIIDAIERLAVLAKIQDAIRIHFSGGVLSPKAWMEFLANNAHLIGTMALLEAAKGGIAALAQGALITNPTLAMIAEAGVPEIVAPVPDFNDFVARISVGNPELLAEVRGMRADIAGLQKTMKNFHMETEITDKGFRVLYKNMNARDSRSKLK